MTFKAITHGWQGKQVSSFGNFRRDRKASNPAVISDGLVLNVDGGNPLSYTGSGTTWTDLSSSATNATLTNSPTYDTSNNGFGFWYPFTENLLPAPAIGKINVVLLLSTNSSCLLIILLKYLDQSL